MPSTYPFSRFKYKVDFGEVAIEQLELAHEGLTRTK
jgi:hypothetical protein